MPQQPEDDWLTEEEVDALLEDLALCLSAGQFLRDLRRDGQPPPPREVLEPLKRAVLRIARHLCSDLEALTPRAEQLAKELGTQINPGVLWRAVLGPLFPAAQG